MAEMNNGYAYGHNAHCNGVNYGTLFFNGESMRREFGNTNEAVRDFALSTGVAIERTSASGQLVTETNAAANLLAIKEAALSLQLQASQNHASLSAQMAECCCDVKSTILADGQKTRDLINSIEADRLRSVNHDLKSELLAIKYATGNGHTAP